VTGHDYLVLLGLAGTVLVTLLGAVWHTAALSTQLKVAVKALEDADKEQKERSSRLEDIPDHARRLGQLERLQSLFPKVVSRVDVMEKAAELRAKHSREMHQVRSGSRPDIEEE
jgi:hypothetical protein